MFFVKTLSRMYVETVEARKQLRRKVTRLRDEWEWLMIGEFLNADFDALVKVVANSP